MVKPGYKETEVGVIPEDWEITTWGEVGDCFSSGATPYRAITEYYNGNIKWVSSGELNYNVIRDTIEHISPQAQKAASLALHPAGTFLMAITGLEAAGTRGSCAILGVPATTNQSCMAIYGTDKLDVHYLFYYYCSVGNELAFKYCQGTKQQSYTAKIVKILPIVIPPVGEQQKIAEALSDMDELIASLEKLIAKKKAVKQGAMQELLTGKKRLPGFDGEWEEYELRNIAVNLDSQRIPVKEAERDKMEGNIPYCGANGILGYVNSYTIDDDIILIAEDGGHFDEFNTRPIAYQMHGKCWVNNHAHIIKATEIVDQTFLFYTLVHKDIRDFITSGTRAKLNKSELEKITVLIPIDKLEQQAIASILSDMDAEIEALEQKLQKCRQTKQGMMQQLLTGKIRLV